MNNTSLLKQTTLGVIYNGLSILFSIITISILIKYLGKENYGYWITIYSICSWINYLDGGLGNSLRNELTISLARGEKAKAHAFISTAYVGIFVFLLAIFFIILFLHIVIDWNIILNDNTINYNYLSLFIFGFFLMQMVLKLLGKIYFSFNKPQMSFFISTITNLFICLFVYFIYFHDIENKLWNISLVYSLVPLVVLSFLSIQFFYINKEYRPNIRNFTKKYLNLILMRGLKFFLIQMNSGLLLALTPFFITLWFSASLAAEYHISIKYYSLMLVLYNIILQTMWGKFTKSHSLRMKKELIYYFFKVIKISIVFVFALIIMYLISTNIFKLWLGEGFIIAPNINFASVAFVVIIIISKTFTNVLNATNNIELQTRVSLVIMIFYFPSVYIAVKLLKLGIFSLILTPGSLFLVQGLFAIYEVRKILAPI